MGLPFDVVTSHCHEVSSQTLPELYVQDLALQKAQATLSLLQKEDTMSALKGASPFVIGSDTVVCCNGEILEKPQHSEHAKRILAKLSGQKHQVHTGVAFLGEDFQHTFYDVTDVEFEPIENDLLDLYVGSGDPLDKAGAYGVQGQAQIFIKSLQGSYSNVVGLPIHLVAKELKKIVQDRLKKQVDDRCRELANWREYFE